MLVLIHLQVYSKRCDEIVGFVHDSSKLATHTLAFMIAGVSPTSTLKQTLAYFGTTSVSAATLYPMFWKAVYILERICGLKVTYVLNN